MPVRHVGTHIDLEMVAVVTTPGGTDVRVRFTRSRRDTTWRCDRCGHSPHPACPHARAVAALAATINKENSR